MIFITFNSGFNKFGEPLIRHRYCSIDKFKKFYHAFHAIHSKTLQTSSSILIGSRKLLELLRSPSFVHLIDIVCLHLLFSLPNSPNTTKQCKDHKKDVNPYSSSCICFCHDIKAENENTCYIYIIIALLQHILKKQTLTKIVAIYLYKL